MGTLYRRRGLVEYVASRIGWEVALGLRIVWATVNSMDSGAMLSTDLALSAFSKVLVIDLVCDYKRDYLMQRCTAWARGARQTEKGLLGPIRDNSAAFGSIGLQ